MLKHAFRCLLYTSLTFFISFEVLACDSTDLSLALYVPSDAKICMSYVKGNEEALQKSTVQLGVNDRIGNPKDWFYLAEKYNYFNRYDEVLFRKRSHCYYETRSLLGVSSLNDLRTCHIAFEESNPNFLMGSGDRNNRILSSIDKEFFQVSETTELVESDFGQTSIRISEYCRNDSTKLVTIAVNEPSQPFQKGDDYSIYISQQKRPLQHFYFTNETCDTSAQ